jgi:predicted dehydrogenase
MDASTDLRVGLLGYGIAGAVFHAPLIAATPGLRLATVVTANPERQAQVAADHPGALVVDHADQLWSEELDLVVVATPNRTHVPLATAALDAGFPVVVDKPFAPTAEEASKLAARAGELGLPLAVFHNRRWDNDFQTVRQLIDAGEFGAVHRFESRFERWRPTPKGGWRELGDPAEAGGALYDLGSHLIDQALQLFGPVRSVYAELDRRRAGVQVDDESFVALTHKNGVRSHLWMGALTAQLGPRMRVLGDKAGYVKFGLDGQEDALRAGNRPGGPEWGVEPASLSGQLGVDGSLRRVTSVPGAYQDFYAQMRDAVRGEGHVPVTPEEAIAVLEVIEQARSVA